MAVRISNAIRLLVTDAALYVANTGRPIDRRGVISIARQYLSAKGETPPDDTFTCSDSRLVEAIRDKRLSLYREEPNDLKEHASQETQTRRDYAGRVLWELLQNADDAMAPAGRPSNELIGAKGLGFKSVLEITERPEIHSGAFHFGFDPDLSEVLLRQVTDDPPKLVFRLPHPAKPDAQVKDLRGAGFATVIKLPFKDEASRKVAEEWLAALPHHFMLLCQHLRLFEAHFRDGTVRQFTRQGGELNANAARAVLKISEGVLARNEEWRVWSRVWPSTTLTDKRLSAAIAIQVDGKRGSPTAEELPFHVFYPTQESVLAPFLVHASMELRSDRNHLLSGAHDKELLSALGELAAAAATYLTPESVLELFRNLAKPPPANVSKMDKKIQRVLGRAILDTPFVPTVGGEKVKPGEARIWAHDLPSVLSQKTEEVQRARLAAPALLEAFPALRLFAAEPLNSLDYARMLNHAACRDRDGCLRAAEIARHGCLNGIYVPSSIISALSKAPFWLTRKGKVRPLVSDRPLVRERPDIWPEWLTADDLDPEFATAVLGKGQTVDQPWASLVNDRLIQTQDDLIVHCLAPVLKSWTEKNWTQRGWEALATVQAWKPGLEWSKIKPFVGGLGAGSDPARAALVNVARVPRGTDWVVALNAYASAEIGGNAGLAGFFRQRADRLVVGMPPKAKSFGRGGWRALLRYLGVSWEPKIMAFVSTQAWVGDGLPCFWRYRKAINEPTLNWRERDWYLDNFPECLAEVSARSTVKMMEVILPATSHLTAAYLKRSDAVRTHRPNPFSSCVDYQLRRETYLHCRPSFAHPEDRGMASDLYWPERGIRGITPIIDLGSLPLAQRQRMRTQFVQLLGVQENLPDSWGPWLNWTDQIAEAIDGGAIDVKEKFVRDFYELFLRAKFNMPRTRAVKRLVCMTANGLRSVQPTHAVWINDPKFAAPEVLQALMNAGLAIFPPMLDRGEGSVARLGVRRASDVVEVKARYFEASSRDADRLTKRLHQRRRAFAAICEQKHEQWSDPPAIRAVHGLTLTFALDGKETGTRAAPAFREERGWLVNLDADPWEALAVVCAAPFRNAADLRHWFTAILKARTTAEIAAILINGGIPPYRLREIALPDEAPSVDEDMPAKVIAGAAAGGGATATDEGGEDISEPWDADDVDLAGDVHDAATPTAPKSGISGSSERGPRSPSVDGVDRNALPPGGMLRKRSLYDHNRGDPTDVSRGAGRAAAAAAASGASARGLAAEGWFAERLKDSLPDGWHPQFNIRDAEVRESDVVLSSVDDSWHIEIKSLTSTRIYWSQLEQQKAEAHPGRYCMAFLVPERSGDYRIYWSWNPLTDLLACERRIDWVWEGTGQGPPLPPDSWEPLAGLKRPERAANRMNFVIELRDDFLRTFPKDDRTLRQLWAKVVAPSAVTFRAAE